MSKPSSKARGVVLFLAVTLAMMGNVKWFFQCDLHTTRSSNDPHEGQQLAAKVAAANSATGSLFLGESFRSFQGERKFRKWKPQKKRFDSRHAMTAGDTSSCSKWSVVTTIFEPAEGVQRAAALSEGWCLVIVADTKTPTDYMKLAKLDQNPSVHFLSVEFQKEWAKKSAVGAFVGAVPWRHFSRKNIGYLYAIAQQPKFIFDFDDDNILDKDSESGRVVDPVQNETVLQNARVPLANKMIFNHHPLMGASIEGSWARGFPLESIQDASTQGPLAYTQDLSMDTIGVLQFCADGNPDIDAVHRLVKPLPMTYDKSSTATPLVVPPHTFAPYNAQATVHTAPALFATFLPSTVPGRVSDIWRGYFAKVLFRDVDLALAFLPPKVVQDRNEHNYLADMKAELDLYFKAGTLLKYLSQWDSKAETVPERMEELWIDMYERGYIEEDDLILLQLWLGALSELGYSFPLITRKTVE